MTESPVVLITGASSGIGEGVAREHAKRGHRLVLCARRKDRLERLAADLGGKERALAVECDVTKDGDDERAVAAAVEAFGRVDIVYANAGFGVVGPVEQMTLDDFRRQFETNVFGMLRTVKAATPALKKTRGRLVLMGSVTSYLTVGGSAPYSMSKHAVKALADALFFELRRDGVAVTLLCPGFVESEIRHVDNKGKFLGKGEDSAPAALVVPVEDAALEIVRGVMKRKRQIVVTGHGKVLVWLQRHVPCFLEFLIKFLKIRSRPHPGTPDGARRYGA